MEKQAAGMSGGVARLNNMLMQMRCAFYTAACRTMLIINLASRRDAATPVCSKLFQCSYMVVRQRWRTLCEPLPTLRASFVSLRRKNANHPDLITGPFEQSIIYPPPDELIKESGKMQLLERMLKKLHAEGHKAR